MNEGLRIFKFTAENIKKLSVVEIVPGNRNVILITGKNGNGKTSTLDALWYLLAGTSNIPIKVIREGEESAIIKADIGEYEIVRKFTQKTTSLTITGSDGIKVSSPQALLDSLIGKITLDPREFSAMKSKEQFSVLKNIVPLDVDLDALDATRQKHYDMRTEYNRRAKEAKVKLDAIALPPNCPSEEVSVSEFAAKYREGAAHNNQNAEKRKELTRLREGYIKAEEEVYKLEQALEASKKIRSSFIEGIKETEQIIDKLEDVDLTEIMSVMSNAETINKQVAQFKKAEELRKEYKLNFDAAQKLSDEIEKIEADKQDALKRAKFPVEGLSFGAGEVLYNGLPFESASDAERLRVSMAIAMASNPKLRIIRIRDGSLLDAASMTIIEEMAKANNFQIFIEVVDHLPAGEIPKVGIVIEDGKVLIDNNN